MSVPSPTGGPQIPHRMGVPDTASGLRSKMSSNRELPDPLKPFSSNSQSATSQEIPAWLTGLVEMHQKMNQPNVHGDIKLLNILPNFASSSASGMSFDITDFDFIMDASAHGSALGAAGAFLRGKEYLRPEYKF